MSPDELALLMIILLYWLESVLSLFSGSHEVFWSCQVRVRVY